MAVVSYKELSGIKDKHPGKKVIFCSGSFDLPHVGHVRFLEACKKNGDILVVAVGKDEDIRKYKGENRPILNESVRIKMIDSLKPVDYCFHNNLSPGINQLSSLEGVFELFKPDVWIVNYDGSEIENRKALAQKYNISFLVLNVDRSGSPDYEGLSTTWIIKKIRGEE